MKGFVHVEADHLVDGEGNPLILRGVGLGNWLLPEGYMWKFESPGPQSPRQIEALFEDLVGSNSARELWQRFRETFVTEDDLARISSEGLNHVRLPVNSRVVMDANGELIDSGFQLIDRLIDWCRAHRLWVVLDLHGAPGGQTGTHIDDSANGAPELFTEDRYWQLTVKLWRAFARRYRDEIVIAAYDLLNEPLPHEYQHTYADRLRDLYLELTSVIRATDPNHVITYEGTHWATNWSIFTEVWDSNSMLQFHKYWSPPDHPSIEQYIEIGRRLGLPIYMGESGENHLDWIQTAFQLFDDCGISWNFWPWKKVETRTSPCSVNAPHGWRRITDYAAGKASKPSHEEAVQTLHELLEAMLLARCTYRPEVISALLRRPPLKIPAVGFGFSGAGRSYQTRSAEPLSSFRSDDDVTVRMAAGGTAEIDWNHGSPEGQSAEARMQVSLHDGEWVAYQIETARPMKLDFRISSSSIGVAVDGTPLDVENAVGGEIRATTRESLAPGRHVLRLTGTGEESLVGAIEVTLVGPQSE